MFTAVDASTAASTSARACSDRTCGPASPPPADPVSSAAVSSASRANCALGRSSRTADGGCAGDSATGFEAPLELWSTVHLPPLLPVVAVQHGAPTPRRTVRGGSKKIMVKIA